MTEQGAAYLMHNHVSQLPRTALRLLCMMLLCHALAVCARTAAAAPPDVLLHELQVENVRSPGEMKTVLTRLERICRESQSAHSFTSSLQKQVITKAGECVGKLADLLREVPDMSAEQRRECRDLFSLNRAIITDVMQVNRLAIEYLQENRMDNVASLADFLASPEWQEPQSLLALARYWLGWNSYYGSLLLPAGDAARQSRLNEAVESFSRTLIDFEDESTVIRSLFGRALSYKTLQEYARAEKDFSLVTARIPRSDPLHVRCRYESALVSFLADQPAVARQKLLDMHEDIERKYITPDMQEAISTLQVNIRLAEIEKEFADSGLREGSACRTLLQQLQQETDGHTADLLREFIKNHAEALRHLSPEELGAPGMLAIADWHFERDEYNDALARYQALCKNTHPSIKKNLDAVYFRIAYIFCHNKQWQAAMPYFESLYKEFPCSPFILHAPGLHYVASANIYRDNPTEGTYDAYIESTKKFIETETDAGGRSDARYELGKYYLERKQTQKAYEQFRNVGRDSANYAAARQYALTADIERLEALQAKGLNQTESARDIYAAAMALVEDYAKAPIAYRDAAHRMTLESNMLLLQVRLALCGPGEPGPGALKPLDGFEERFSNDPQRCREARSLRLQFYVRTGQTAEAEGAVDRLLSRHPEDPQVWDLLIACADSAYQKARRLRGSGESDSAGSAAPMALVLYDRLASMAGNSPDRQPSLAFIQVRRAELYLDQQKTGDAKNMIQEVLRRDPLSADAIYILAHIHEQEGGWEEALATWRTFSDGLPVGSRHWFEARYGIAKALRRLGRIDQACSIISMTRVLHPDLRDEQFKEKFLKLQREICQ
jgi:tetratricopeptide (TPR) repeat protein